MDRVKEINRVSLITVVINIVLAAAKVVTGLITGSGAVLSDAVHTLSDVFTTFLVIIGVKLSSGKADKGHPYGHYRVEPLISLMLAAILGITACGIGFDGVKKLISGETAQKSWLAVGVTVASIVSKEFMFHYTARAAKRLKSTAMMADAWHHRSDSISSVAVLIGVGGAFFGLNVLEPLATVVVSLIILAAVVEISKAAIHQLMDSSAGEEVYSEILQKAASVPGVVTVDMVKTRLSNQIVFVEMEISVSPVISVSAGHEIAENVHAVIESLPYSIEHCSVHVNPVED